MKIGSVIVYSFVKNAPYLQVGWPAPPTPLTARQFILFCTLLIGCGRGWLKESGSLRQILCEGSKARSACAPRFLCYNTSNITSKFDFSNVKLGSILTTIAEKLSSCFYEILSKTFYMTLMYQIHQDNGLIAKFLGSSTY